MPEEEETSTAKFCWVKAVMQAPPCDDGAGSSACEAPWTQECTKVPGAMPPPPSPNAAADASGLPKTRPYVDDMTLKFLGGGTPPPPDSAIPQIPVNQENSLVVTGHATGGYWQIASFAPGRELDRGPVVSLVFMPVKGSREQAMHWRIRNGGWFRDAVAVTLLNYNQGEAHV